MTSIREAQAKWSPTERARFRRSAAEIAVEAARLQGKEPHPDALRVLRESTRDQA